MTCGSLVGIGLLMGLTTLVLRLRLEFTDEVGRLLNVLVGAV